jgi:putative ABC transport system permease protein
LMSEYLAGAQAQTRFVMIMLGTFSVVALVMAIVGLYGVISFGVRQRTHELGVRIALGASRANIVAMVLRQGLSLTITGAAIGVALSVAMSRVLSNLLFGVTGADPLTYLGIAGLLVAVSAGATFIPARRASRVPPAQVLRAD